MSVALSEAIWGQEVRPRAKVQQRRVWKFVPAVLLFFSLIAQLYVRIEIIEAGYRLEMLRSQALKNDALLRELRFTYASLTGPASLQEQAKKRLGLQVLPPQRIRRVVDGEGAR